MQELNYLSVGLKSGSLVLPMNGDIFGVSDYGVVFVSLGLFEVCEV